MVARPLESLELKNAQYDKISKKIDNEAIRAEVPKFSTVANLERKWRFREIFGVLETYRRSKGNNFKRMQEPKMPLYERLSGL